MQGEASPVAPSAMTPGASSPRGIRRYAWDLSRGRSYSSFPSGFFFTATMLGSVSRLCGFRSPRRAFAMIRRAAAGDGNHSVHARPFSMHRCNKSSKGAIGDEKDVGVGGVRRRDSLLSGFGHGLCWDRGVKHLRGQASSANLPAPFLLPMAPVLLGWRLRTPTHR